MTRSRSVHLGRMHRRLGWHLFRKEREDDEKTILPFSVEEKRNDTSSCLAPAGRGIAHESDYEQISHGTPNLGKIRMCDLSFSNRQLVRSQHKNIKHLQSSSKRIMMLVTNRGTKMPIYYILLRMGSFHFWLSVILVQLGLALFGSITFIGITGQRYGLAIALALDVNGLSVGDTECKNDGYYGQFISIPICRGWAAILRLIHFVQLLFIGGIIVVRLSRVIAKHRFEFSKKAVLYDNELCIRICSARPATVIAPTFRLEYFDFQGRAHPLELINGGAIAYIHDAVLYLRHEITRDSPFFSSDWRNHINKVRVALSGFDELLAQDVVGTHVYYQPDIIENAKYKDMIFRAKIQFSANTPPHQLLCSDMSRLDEIEVIQSKQESNKEGGIHNVAQLDALTEEDLKQKLAPATQTQVGLRPGLAPRALSLLVHRDNQQDNNLETIINKNVSEYPHLDNKQINDDPLHIYGIPKMNHNSLRRRTTSSTHMQEEPIVCLNDLQYIDRQMIIATSKSGTTPEGLCLLVTNRRRRVPYNYLFLRMRADHFWISIVFIWILLAFFAAIFFVFVAGQSAVDSILLSLDAHNLAVGDVECQNGSYGYGWLLCRFVAVIIRLIVFICELFFGGLIIVRLSRVVVRDRFRFSNFCVITKGRKELVLRLVSNRPSSVVMPSFILEYMDAQGKRLHPLELTTAGSVAYLSDSTFFLRHKINQNSPFFHSDWRNRVLGVRVAVMGHDSLLAAEACGCRYYTHLDIRDDVDYGSMVSIALLRFNKMDHHAYLVDMRNINLVTERSLSTSSLQATTQEEDIKSDEEIGGTSIQPTESPSLASSKQRAPDHHPSFCNNSTDSQDHLDLIFDDDLAPQED